jgi:hypothetical protein
VASLFPDFDCKVVASTDKKRAKTAAAVFIFIFFIYNLLILKSLNSKNFNITATFI